jgi:hypothetical protein
MTVGYCKIFTLAGKILGPYTETIDLCLELFLVKEIMLVIERLQEIKPADK